jgi:uncharacterized SAM-binding protein YcdF (DUF218 family)
MPAAFSGRAAPRPPWQRRLLRGSLAGVVIALCCEAAFWVGSLDGTQPHAGARCIVLVPGYPSETDGSPHPVQRLRVEAGVEVLRARGCEKIVLSGGAAHNALVEADTMARVAQDLGVGAEQLVLERQATTTWENVKLSLPVLDGYDAIVIASDGLQVHRAKRYLCRQRPDLCARTTVFATYSPFRLFWWKVPAALYELRAFLRDLFIEAREDREARGKRP